MLERDIFWIIYFINWFVIVLWTLQSSCSFGTFSPANRRPALHDYRVGNLSPIWEPPHISFVSVRLLVARSWGRSCKSTNFSRLTESKITLSTCLLCVRKLYRRFILIRCDVIENVKLKEDELLGSLDWILHVERRHSVLLAQDLCRWLDRLHIVNHLRNFPVNYAEKEFCIVQRDALLFAEHVEDGRLVALQQPGREWTRFSISFQVEEILVSHRKLHFHFI
jgi:hypothetical protein